MKNFYSSSVISYGAELPQNTSALDGSLFLKTAEPGAGLYVYNFSQDTYAGIFGDQSGQRWNLIAAISGGQFVPTIGGQMSGTLSVGGFNDIGGVNVRLNSAAGFNPGSVEFTSGSGSPVGSMGWSQLDGRLQINGAWHFATTPKVATNDIWHAGNDGAGSGLDADLLDGQDSTFYRNASNMNSGALALARGGTAANLTFGATGGVVWKTASALGVSVAGSAGEILVSGGSGAPTWASAASLTVPTDWVNIGGLPNAVFTSGASGNIVSTRARPSLFYEMSSTGGSSMLPIDFQSGSVSGFDAPNTSDMGLSQVGLTVVGTGGGNTRALQLAANWDFEEGAPSGLRFRVNDTTGNITAWGSWRTLWDQGNLTDLSQLSNGPGYVNAATLGNYVLKAGDTITGPIVLNSTLSATGIISTTSQMQAGLFITTGASDVGSATLRHGQPAVWPSPASSGLLEFTSAAGVRQAFIGRSTTFSIVPDTGTIQYAAGTHRFSGAVHMVNDALRVGVGADAGASGSVLVSNGPGGAPSWSAAYMPIGVGQIWYNATGVRTHTTVYRNLTGRPIMVNVTAGNNGRRLQTSVDSVTWIDVGQVSGGSDLKFGSAIIPEGWYYRVNGSCSIAFWSELRSSPP